MSAQQDIISFYYENVFYSKKSPVCYLVLCLNPVWTIDKVAFTLQMCVLQLSATMLTTLVTYYHRLQTHLILKSSDGPTVPGLEFVREIGTT